MFNELRSEVIVRFVDESVNYPSMYELSFYIFARYKNGLGQDVCTAIKRI